MASNSEVQTSSGRAARRSVSGDGLIATAMAIADGEGLEALTIRRLAADLGLGTMTVYGHVRTKDELVDRVVEAALSTLEIPSADSGTWEERLERLFANLHDLLWRHPCVLYADIQTPLIGPAALRAADAALAIVNEGGIGGDDAVEAMSMLLSFTFGSALFRLNQAGEGRANYETQIRIADPQRLPRVVEHAPALLARGSGANFGRGVRLIIRGLTADVSETRAP